MGGLDNYILGERESSECARELRERLLQVRLERESALECKSEHKNERKSHE